MLRNSNLLKKIEIFGRLSGLLQLIHQRKQEVYFVEQKCEIGVMLGTDLFAYDFLQLSLISAR